ncbi:VRR-NUC domain-containing protein [Cupriavidus basilensis]|uniref:VRR-NUC domain-containing protein n=1 Tax=Cupriavidus basilensis TaxID=68895 RepID=A0ABT6AZA5_9BURK|nr:VRR-NUC domain-containing protein [Cupriavidus basilensis]MDF3837933.1 VRR-NUC domain-containing protein [Cupriavidus basilensis]
MAWSRVAVSVLVGGVRAYLRYEARQTRLEGIELKAHLYQRREQVKKVLRSVIESFASEIHTKSSTFAQVDHGGRSTISRRGKEGTTYKEYIERKVPFRPAISIACTWAKDSPIKVPRRILKKIGGELVSTTIDVFLKQTTASLIFEAIDETLDWQSPLKAEPNYMNGKAWLGEPPTRPRRVTDAFPFWPRPKGSLAPDLAIVEYRQQPFHVPNVFVAVEIKFPKDWVKKKQMKDYVNLMKQDETKVALLRVPEDCTGYKPKESQAEESGRQNGRKKR